MRRAEQTGALHVERNQWKMNQTGTEPSAGRAGRNSAVIEGEPHQSTKTTTPQSGAAGDGRGVPVTRSVG
jgi:hypothetical protein